VIEPGSGERLTGRHRPRRSAATCKAWGNGARSDLKFVSTMCNIMLHLERRLIRIRAVLEHCECRPECLAPEYKKQREGGMRTVVIRIPRLELSAQMAAMRKWFAKHRCEPSLFTSKRDEMRTLSLFMSSLRTIAPCAYFLMSRSGRSIFSTISLRRTREQWSGFAGGGSRPKRSAPRRRFSRLPMQGTR
jgi:hypothetical protein